MKLGRWSWQLAMCVMLAMGCAGSKKGESGEKNADPVETSPTSETSTAPESQPATEETPEADGDPDPQASASDPRLEGMTALDKLDYAALEQDAYIKEQRDKFNNRPNPSHQDLLRFGIKAGLYIDGVKPEFVGNITDESHGKLFVGKCKICDPVRGGFNAYAGSGVTPLGKGLSPTLVTAFTGEDYDARNKSLTFLVNRYTKLSWELLEISGDARRDYEDQLASARKSGMSSKPHSMKNCPSCDGANDIDEML